jgi:hypothetical protein
MWKYVGAKTYHKNHQLCGLLSKKWTYIEAKLWIHDMHQWIGELKTRNSINIYCVTQDQTAGWIFIFLYMYWPLHLFAHCSSVYMFRILYDKTAGPMEMLHYQSHNTILIRYCIINKELSEIFLRHTTGKGYLPNVQKCCIIYFFVPQNPCNSECHTIIRTL